jgi:hypothetical protein
MLTSIRGEAGGSNESLGDDARGGFRQNAEIGVNRMSTTDVAGLREHWK